MDQGFFPFIQHAKTRVYQADPITASGRLVIEFLFIASDVESIGISDVIPVLKVGPGAILFPYHL